MFYRSIRFTLVAVLFVGSFWLVSTKVSKPQPAKAGALTNISVTPVNNSKSTSDTSINTTYTVSLTNATKIPATSGRINVQFYGAGWDYDFNNATVASGTSPNTISVYTRSWNGLVFSTSSDIAANSNITLKIGNVKNPTKGGYYFAHVWTSDYSTALDGSADWNGNYNSAYFEIGSNTNVVGAITNSDGTGVPFASISMYSNNYSNYFNAYSDVNGNYGIGDVPAGTYTFYIYSSSSYNCDGVAYATPPTTTVTVASSGVATKNVSFPAITKTVSGKVTRNSSTGTAVTDAYVSLYKSGSSGGGYACAYTDSSGNYSFSLSGGTWTMSISPRNWPADWTYSNTYESLDFVDDSSTESKTKNFIAESLSATITGTVQKPDGTNLSQYSVGVSFSNSKNQWFSASFDTNGNFTAQVTPSTYSISGWLSDNNYSFPKVDSFSVGENETKNLGAITLTEKTDVINVTVKDNTDAVVPSAYISAWKNETNAWDWGSCQTGTDGICSIKVTPGTWQVSAWPQWKEGGNDHVYSGEPVSVTVTSGTPANQSFTFQKASATINGVITDPDGNILTNLSSWASASDGSDTWSNIGASVTNGKFTLKVPAGTWDITVYIYGNEYGTADPAQVNITDNETKSVTIATVKVDATISGTIYDESNNKITNKWISIWATKGRYGSWQSASVDQSSATYSLKVSAGTWNLGWWIDQSLGYSSGNGNEHEVKIASGETKTYDIVLKKSDSTISGKAKKSDGTAMQWAWITADSRDPNEKKKSDTYYYSNGASSNSNGDYTLQVPAGTYWIGANMWPGSGYINPKRQKVTVDATNSANIDLTFRQADAAITGKVTKEGTGISAYVTAWSEDGGYSEATANNSGDYSISVSKGTKWHVSSVKEVDKDIWKSAEKVVDMTDATSATQDLTLEKKNFSMPEAVTLTLDPSNPNTVTLDDGTTISAPANSISTTASTVNLTAQPTATLAEESDAKPLGYGYELNITDENGSEISKFNSNVTIETKYTDDMVSGSTVQNEDELIVGYYDESAGTWIELNNCSVNKDENTVTCQVDHFTKFAIVSATDTTAPTAPTNISATAGDGKVVLSWTNSSDGDLNGVNVYRSTTSGTVGSKVHSNVTGTSKEDTGLTNGTAYYYVVKAVDKSGNESNNTTQVSAKPQAGLSTSTTSAAATTTTTLPKTGRPAARTNILVSMICLIVLSGMVVKSRKLGSGY